MSRLIPSAAELSTLLETVETTLNGLPDSLTDVPAVVGLSTPARHVDAYDNPGRAGHCH